MPYVGLEAGQETLPRPVSPFRDNFVGAGAGLISQRAKISARFLSTPPPVFDEASHRPSLGASYNPETSGALAHFSFMWEDKHSVALVVEDEMLLQLHAAGLLQEHGFAVVEAANAANACQAIKSSGGKVRARP